MGEEDGDGGDTARDGGGADDDAGAARVDGGDPRVDGGDGDGGTRVDGGALDAGSVGPARYSSGRVHAPLAPRVLERLRAFRAAHADRDGASFAKVGDSMTVSTSFFRCFGGDDVDLDGRPLQPTIDHFAATTFAPSTSTPFDRASVAAGVGWSASRPLQGDPSPLDVELETTNPAYAVVMFGTNDIQLGSPVGYANDLLALVDALLARGVIPVVSTIPPRGDSTTADAEVPRYNLVARAIAESRQVPFVDLESVLRPLPSYGLGADDLHPSADPRGACFLDEPGLQYGYDARNLVTLEALDRVRRAIDGGPLDPDDPPRPGAGTYDDPFLVDALPFTDARDTTGGAGVVDAWTGCAAADERAEPLTARRHDVGGRLPAG